MSRRPGRISVLVVSSALVAGAPGLALGYAWHGIGPRGGGALAIAVDANPTTLYAIGDFNPGLAGGFHRSADGGATWSDATIVGNVLGIGADPSTPGTVFAALAEYVPCSTCYTVTLRVAKSTDGGALWSDVYDEELTSGIPLGQGQGFNHLGVAVDPASPSTVHVGGWVRSLDGGATWTHVAHRFPRWRTWSWSIPRIRRSSMRVARVGAAAAGT